VTIINAGMTTATGVGIFPRGAIAASVMYQTTDPLTNLVTGLPNTPVDIAPGTLATYMVTITPTEAFAPIEVAFAFSGSNTVPVDTLVGINTILLSSSSTPTPDIVALAATLNGDGIVDIRGATGTGFFAVATVNVGTGGRIIATADTGNASLPVSVFMCQTNSQSGACLEDPTATVTVQIDAGSTPTFGAFVQGDQRLPFNPGESRVFVRFRDVAGVMRGTTSVAVRTQ
jgi:hypothetical protein